jgi:hypothetical protein
MRSLASKAGKRKGPDHSIGPPINLAVIGFLFTYLEAQLPGSVRINEPLYKHKAVFHSFPARQIGVGSFIRAAACKTAESLSIRDAFSCRFPPQHALEHRLKFAGR